MTEFNGLERSASPTSCFSILSMVDDTEEEKGYKYEEDQQASKVIDKEIDITSYSTNNLLEVFWNGQVRLPILITSNIFMLAFGIILGKRLDLCTIS